jgi:hypothetical protein
VGVSTPIEIDAELAQLRTDIDLWDKRLAWFGAKRDWYKTKLALAEAKAAMDYTGPATKAKWYSITRTEKERTDLDIAEAELLMCERRMHSLDKATYLLLGRNKNAMNAYTTERW